MIGAFTPRIDCIETICLEQSGSRAFTKTAFFEIAAFELHKLFFVLGVATREEKRGGFQT